MEVPGRSTGPGLDPSEENCGTVEDMCSGMELKTDESHVQTTDQTAVDMSNATQTTSLSVSDLGSDKYTSVCTTSGTQLTIGELHFGMHHDASVGGTQEVGIQTGNHAETGDAEAETQGGCVAGSSQSTIAETEQSTSSTGVAWWNGYDVIAWKHRASRTSLAARLKKSFLLNLQKVGSKVSHRSHRSR